MINRNRNIDLSRLREYNHTPSGESKTEELTITVDRAVLAANTQNWRADRIARRILGNPLNSAIPTEMQ